MTEERIVAIDVGSGLTKGTDGKEKLVIGSVVVRGSLDGRFGLEKATPVSWKDGESWLVGEDAIAFGDTQDYANTLSKDWAGSDGWWALLYAMLGKLGARGKVKLVTGVPMAWYQELAKPLYKELSGQHRFQYGKKTIELELDIQVIPQAIGALYYHAGRLDKQPLKLAVIDIGTFTTGFSVVANERTVPHQCGGIELGTSVLTGKLSEHLKEEYGYSTDLLTYHEILKTGVFEHRGKQKNISQVLQSLATMASEPLLKELRKLWNNKNEMTVLVGGGGADLFLEPIKIFIPHAKSMDGGIFSVAEGMYLLASLKNG